MYDPATSASMPDLILRDANRRKRMQADAFVEELAASETALPDAGGAVTAEAPAAPADTRTANASTGAELRVPGMSPEPEGAAPSLPWWQQERFPLQGEKPQKPAEMTDGNMSDYVAQSLNWMTPALPALSIPDVFNALDLPAPPVSDSASEAWGGMTDLGKREAVSRYFGNPYSEFDMILDDMRREGGPAPRPAVPDSDMPFDDSIDGQQGDDTLPAADAVTPDDDGAGWFGRAARDVGMGIVEAPRQIAGGIVDAMFEIGSLLNTRGPEIEMAIDPESGDVTATVGRSAADLDAEQRARFEDSGLSAPEARSVTGGLVRGVSQFLAGFAAGGRALQGAGWAAGTATTGRAMTQAALSDFAAFDGHEARLSDLVEEFPALSNPVTEYLASDMDDSELEGRLKNVAEGALSDVILTGLVASLRGVRIARRVRDENGARSYTQAARQASADSRTADDVLPDADAVNVYDTPLVVKPGETKPTVPLSDLGQGGNVRTMAKELRAFLDNAGVSQTPDDDGLGAALAQLREGRPPAGGRLRPAAAELIDRGGVDPQGPLGRELRARDITPRTYPGLFRRGGLKDADNIPVSDVEIFRARDGIDDGNGYIPQDAWIEALQDEASRAPWMTTAQQDALADGADAGLERLAEDLDRVGIDWRAMSDDEVRAAIEADRREALEMEGIDLREDSTPRSAEDLDAELAARVEAGDPNLSAVDDGAGNKVYVNWGRIATAHDVRALIQRMADMGAGEIDEARRGVRSNEATEAAADQQDAWALLLDRRKGQALNAEETLALRRLWSASGEKLAEVARLAARKPTPENSFSLRRAMALHGTIQREVLAVRTETARALQQWAIPAGSGEIAARQMAAVVEDHGSAEVSRHLAERLTNLLDQGRLDAAERFVQKGALARTSDAVFFYWINSILSGPATHAVGLISNTAMSLLGPLERATATGIGTARRAVGATGRAEAGVSGFEPGETGAMLHGLLMANREAFSAAWHTLRTGEQSIGNSKWTTTRMNPISAEAFNVQRPGLAKGIDALGAVVGAPIRAIIGADEFYKIVNYRAQLHALTFRQAAREVRDGAIEAGQQTRRIAELLDDVPEALDVQAREFSMYNTLNDDPGTVARNLENLVRDVPGMRYFAPFIPVLSNVLSYNVARSPLAPASTAWRADFAAGGGRRDLALARAGLGSMAMLLFVDMALNGQLTGGGPSSPAEKAKLRRQGWQPNSVRVGDDYYAVNRLDPIGTHMNVAANIVEMTLNGGIEADEDISEAVIGAAGALSETLMDKTMLTGIADLVQFTTDAERYGESVAQRFVGSFVPTALRTAATTMDPTLRAPSDLREAMMTRIPGLSDDVPARRDLWGREISWRSHLGPTYDAVSPAYASRLDPEPIDTELMRLDMDFGLPSKTVTIDGERFSLRNRPEVYERYLVLQGQTPASTFPEELTSRGNLTAASERMIEHGDRTLLEALNQIVEGGHPWADDYAQADDEERFRMLRRAIDGYRHFARRRLIEDFPDVFSPGEGRSRMSGTQSPYSRFVAPTQPQPDRPAQGAMPDITAAGPR